MKETRVDMLEAKSGMVLSQSVYDHYGRLLLPVDFILTPKTIMLLKLNQVEWVHVKDLLYESNDEEDFESARIERIRQTEDFKTFERAYGHSVTIVKEAFEELLTNDSQINASILSAEINRVLATSKNSIQVFDMLHCIRDYDDTTYVHCMNVALICNVIGGWLGYQGKDIEDLTLAGLLHDIGKLMIPKEIITKPTKLSVKEYEVVKKHPHIGYEILEDEELEEHIRLAALEHHEKCDGSGYPYGLKREEISEFAKIVAIADVYDAMTADRTYRMGLCPFDVIELFEAQGLQKYDARILLLFLEYIVASYINKQVVLSDGSIAKIIFINKHKLSKPVVARGKQYIDLSESSSLTIKAIL